MAGKAACATATTSSGVRGLGRMMSEPPLAWRSRSSVAIAAVRSAGSSVQKVVGPPSRSRRRGAGSFSRKSRLASLGGGRAKLRPIAIGSRTTLGASGTGYCGVVSTRSKWLGETRGLPSCTARMRPCARRRSTRTIGAVREPIAITRSGGSPSSIARDACVSPISDGGSARSSQRRRAAQKPF